MFFLNVCTHISSYIKNIYTKFRQQNLFLFYPLLWRRFLCTILLYLVFNEAFIVCSAYHFLFTFFFFFSPFTIHCTSSFVFTKLNHLNNPNDFITMSCLYFFYRISFLLPIFSFLPHAEIITNSSNVAGGG